MNGAKDECKKIRMDVGRVRKARGCQLMERKTDDESGTVAMIDVIAWRVVSRVVLRDTKTRQDQSVLVAGPSRTMGAIITLPKGLYVHRPRPQFF